VRHALVLQHQDDCPPGLLGTWAAARGVELETVRPDRGEPLPKAPRHDAIVVLGSDKSVNDPLAWIENELEWLQAAVEFTEVPVLGVCFGSQALAVALGGEVHREEPEIAWLELDVNGAEPPIEPGPWLCWHNDFISPPPDARTLARSPRAVQAYVHGTHLGIQFHPEVTPAIVADWTRTGHSTPFTPDLARAGLTPADLAAQTAAHAEPAALAAHRLFDTWVRHVGTG
jgi:GMP synthase-like glutamine amidotransferase